MKTFLLTFWIVINLIFSNHSPTNLEGNELSVAQGSSLESQYHLGSALQEANSQRIGRYSHSRKILQAQNQQEIFSENGYRLSFLTNEFAVHSSTRASQLLPNMIGLPGGNSAYTWLSFHLVGTGAIAPSVMLRIVDKVGTFLSAEIQVSDQVASGEPYILDLKNGNFMVIWTQKDNMQVNRVYARVFAYDGTESVSTFLISSGTSLSPRLSPHVDCRKGVCVAAWYSIPLGSSVNNIYMQRFYINGTTIEGEQIATVHTTADKLYPKVLFFQESTHYMISWLDKRMPFPNTNYYDTYAQLYYENGTMLLTNDLRLNSYTYQPDVSAGVGVDSLDDARGIVTWGGVSIADLNKFSVFYVIVSDNGQLEGAESEVEPGDTLEKFFPDVAVFPDNLYAIIWSSFTGSIFESGTDPYSTIHGQFFQSNKLPLAGKITFSNGTQFIGFYPKITVSEELLVLVAWQSSGEDVDNSEGINARILEFFIPTQSPTNSPSVTPTTDMPSPTPTAFPTLSTLLPSLSPTKSPTTALRAWWKRAQVFVYIGMGVVVFCIGLGSCCYISSKSERATSGDIYMEKK